MFNSLAILCFYLSCFTISTPQKIDEQFDHAVEFWTIPPQFLDAPREFMKSTCANELISCYTITALKIPICASTTGPFMNKQSKSKYFATICDMQYVNCKAAQHIWSYLKDSDGTCAT